MASLSPAETEELTAFAERLANRARDAILPFFRQSFRLENKDSGGFDPVTEADSAAEEAIRAEIAREFPDHGILGEEFGETPSDGPFRWVIDPIDGTRAFMAGLPLWTTLIALEREGAPVIGVIDQGFTDERWIGDGKAARYIRNGASRMLRTRSCRALGVATIVATDPRPGHMFDEREAEIFTAIADSARLARFGTDAYAYAMLAGGNVDIVMEAGLQRFDVAALIPVVEGAGGRMTGWTEPDARDGGRVLAVGDPALHAEISDCVARLERKFAE
ncbi:MAG: histidinol-phosphatase [Parvularculaceae bacterium]